MAEFEFAGLSPDVAAKNQAAFQQLAERYRSDAAFKSSIDGDAAGALREIGMMIPPGTSVHVVADSDSVMHIVMPEDPNMDLSDEALDMVAGGDTTSSAGTAGTMSTALSSTMVSSAGTAGCASTAASS